MIIFKQHTSHDVAHLYEHLIVAGVIRFFDTYNLYPYYDYELSGTTSHGVVKISVKCHTPEARRIESAIPNVKPPLDKSSIHAALLQIGAEKECTPSDIGESESSIESLKATLREVDSQPWTDVDDFEYVIPYSRQLQNSSLFRNSEKVPVETSSLAISVSLDDAFATNNQQLLPLFWHIAALVQDNIEREFFIEDGFYLADIKYSPEQKVSSLVNYYRISPYLHIDVNEMMAIISEVVEDLFEEDIITKSLSKLQKATARDTQNSIPSISFIYDRTGVLIGTKGWRKIATKQNSQLLIEHIHIAAQFGEQKSTRSLTSLIK